MFPICQKLSTITFHQSEVNSLMKFLYQTAIVPAIRNILTALTKAFNSVLLTTDKF